MSPRILMTVLSCAMTLPVIAGESHKKGPVSVYDFEMKSIDGKSVKLSKYEGDVLLIVNVASK